MFSLHSPSTDITSKILIPLGRCPPSVYPLSTRRHIHSNSSLSIPLCISQLTENLTWRKKAREQGLKIWLGLMFWLEVVDASFCLFMQWNVLMWFLCHFVVYLVPFTKHSSKNSIIMATVCIITTLHCSCVHVYRTMQLIRDQRLNAVYSEACYHSNPLPLLLSSHLCSKFW